MSLPTERVRDAGPSLGPRVLFVRTKSARARSQVPAGCPFPSVPL